MLKKLVAVAFAAALVTSGAACSSDDDEGGSGGGTQAELADMLQESAQSEDGVELSDDEASCLAGVMIDSFGEEEVQTALDSGEEPNFDEAMSDDPEEALEFLNQLTECAPDLMGMSTEDGESVDEG